MVRNRPAIICLVVSILFHLSMISVFSIVIRFPSRYVHYASLEIVEAAAPSFRIAERSQPERGVLTVPPPDIDSLTEFNPDMSIDDAFGETFEDPWATELPIELPRLEFAELERREQSLRIRSELTDDPELPRQDSWAAFTSGLKDLGSMVASLAGSPGDDSAVGPERVATPAPGFVAYLEWVSEPKDRTLLFSPPIQALWSVDPHSLRSSLEFLFKIDALGKVEEIQIVMDDGSGVAASVANAILKYRFEPLQAGPRVQRGTLTIKAEPAP